MKESFKVKYKLIHCPICNKDFPCNGFRMHLRMTKGHEDTYTQRFGNKKSKNY